MPVAELAMDVLALLLAYRVPPGRGTPPRRGAPPRCGTPPRRGAPARRWAFAGRVLLGAAAGTLVSIAVRGLRLSRPAVAALWLPTALMMAALCGGPRGALRGAVRVTLAAALLGGLTAALAGALDSVPAGRALSAICALALVCAGRLRRRADAARVFVRFRGRQAAFPALVDSGNRLRDYLTGLPVIVLPEDAARAALGLSGAALRPIVAQTAGGRAMMWCFVPEEAAVFSGGCARRVRAAVALSPGMQGDAPALVPAELA